MYIDATDLVYCKNYSAMLIKICGFAIPNQNERVLLSRFILRF